MKASLQTGLVFVFTLVHANYTIVFVRRLVLRRWVVFSCSTYRRAFSVTQEILASFYVLHVVQYKQSLSITWSHCLYLYTYDGMCHSSSANFSYAAPWKCDSARRFSGYPEEMTLGDQHGEISGDRLPMLVSSSCQTLSHI